MEQFPTEIFLNIFSYISAEDLYNFCKIKKEYYHNYWRSLTVISRNILDRYTLAKNLVRIFRIFFIDEELRNQGVLEACASGFSYDRIENFISALKWNQVLLTSIIHKNDSVYEALIKLYGIPENTSEIIYVSYVYKNEKILNRFINPYCKKRESPLDLGLPHSKIMKYAAKYGQLETIKMITEFFDDNPQQPILNYTDRIEIIENASEYGHEEIVVYLLNNKKYNIVIRGALCKSHKIEIMKILYPLTSSKINELHFLLDVCKLGNYDLLYFLIDEYKDNITILNSLLSNPYFKIPLFIVHYMFPLLKNYYISLHQNKILPGMDKESMVRDRVVSIVVERKKESPKVSDFIMKEISIKPGELFLYSCGRLKATKLGISIKPEYEYDLEEYFPYISDKVLNKGFKKACKCINKKGILQLINSGRVKNKEQGIFYVNTYAPSLDLSYEEKDHIYKLFD